MMAGSTAIEYQQRMVIVTHSKTIPNQEPLLLEHLWHDGIQEKLCYQFSGDILFCLPADGT
jgi:hypothetical protein